jgi:hypothetical protein
VLVVVHRDIFPQIKYCHQLYFLVSCGVCVLMTCPFFFPWMSNNMWHMHRIVNPTIRSTVCCILVPSVMFVEICFGYHLMGIIRESQIIYARF